MSSMSSTALARRDVVVRDFGERCLAIGFYRPVGGMNRRSRDGHPPRCAPRFVVNPQTYPQPRIFFDRSVFFSRFGLVTATFEGSAHTGSIAHSRPWDPWTMRMR